MRKRFEVILALMVIVVLIALILPAIQQAQESARRTQCMNNMRQLALGLANYHDAFSTFPVGTVGSADRQPDHRWSFYPNLTPFLAQAAEPPINYLTDSRDSTNWPLIFEVRKQETLTVSLSAPPCITCPIGASDHGEHEQKFAGYVGVTGIGPLSAIASQQSPQAGVWGYDRCTSISDISDSLEDTILLIEAASNRDVWLFGGHPTTRWASADTKNLGKDRTFGGFHSGITMCAMVSGSVRNVSDDIEPALFIQMSRISEVGERSGEGERSQMHQTN